MSQSIVTEEEKLVLTERAAEKLRDFDGPVVLELDITITIGLIGQLQLAFRHPLNSGPTRQMVERFVRDLIDKIDPSKGDVWKFLMMGFDKRYDE